MSIANPSEKVTLDLVSYHYPVQKLDQNEDLNLEVLGFLKKCFEWCQNTYHFYYPELTIDRMKVLLETNNSPRRYKTVTPISTLFQTIYIIANPNVSKQILSLPRNPNPDSESKKSISGGTIVETIRQIFGDNIFTYCQSKNLEFRKLYKFRLIDRAKTYIPKLYEQGQETSKAWLQMKSINATEETKIFVAHAVIRNLLAIESKIDPIRQALKIITRAIREVTFKKFPRTSDSQIMEAKSVIVQGMSTIKGDDNFVTDLQKAQINMHFSNEEINNAVMGIFFASQDTTTNTVAFFLYHLGKNPIWQDEIFKEWTEWKSSNKTLEQYILDEHTKLHACLQESHRVTPSAFILMRKADKDCFVNNEEDQTSILIPKDSALLIANYFMNRDERWENPDDFNPQRFLGDKPKPFFHPFSFGPNQCVGRVFATYEIKCLMLSLIEHGKWKTLNDELKLTSTLALTSYEDIHIEYQAR